MALVATVYDGISDDLAAWMADQPVFFVGTAPLAADGHVNVSPKGMAGTFAVVDPHTVAYLDYSGSGAETIAHLRENGRVVLMFCAFSGRPTIVRLHGRGRVVLAADPGFAELRRLFPKDREVGQRSVVVVEVDRVADACGFAVPLMEFQGDRDVLDAAQSRRDDAYFEEYWRTRNAESIDGLPAVAPPMSPGGASGHPRVTSWSTHRITVPGATLHAEVSGPPLEPPAGTSLPLVLVGHPMGAGDFRDLAEHFTSERTVVLHDPRGFGASPLDDPTDDADPDRLADDLAALLDEVAPGRRVDVLGSSGGAVTALALAARHPGRVRVVVAHEPPLFSALPDAEAAAVRREAEAVVALLHAQGVWPAMGAFAALAGFAGPDGEDAPGGGAPDAPDAPDTPDDVSTDPPGPDHAAALERMIGRGLLTVCGYPLDVPALQAARAGGVRLVAAAGEASGTQLARRCAEAVAERLGLPTTLFPGDHAPWVVAMGGDPAVFAARLEEVLDAEATGAGR